jgi:hypothetical protein
MQCGVEYAPSTSDGLLASIGWGDLKIGRGEKLQMASPVLNDRDFDDGPVTEPIQPGQPEDPDIRGYDAALTARAVVAVSAMGVLFWYLLWKIALHFMDGR